MRSRVAKNELDLLSRVPLFSGCSQAELRQVAVLGTHLEVPEGTELTTEGQPGSEFFLVIEGEAVSAIRGATVADLGPGDYFGELALLDGGIRMATVTAATAMRVVALTRAEFASLIRGSQGIPVKLLANLAGRLRDARMSAIY